MITPSDHPQPSPPGSEPARIGDSGSFLTAIERLEPSSEPAVVFSNLAEVCVPAFSDGCLVDIEEGPLIYRISYPSADGGSAVGSVATPRYPYQLSTAFDIGPEGAPAPRCSGVVTYFWHQTNTSVADAVIARLLTDRAAAIVERQRRLADANQAAATIANLMAGLASNRQVATAVGILMATHKLAEPDAFAMLRMASQRTHRKVRDIADDVVLTGELEQAPGRRRPHTGPCTKG